MQFRRVAVLMGGPSEERTVSLNSGRAVAGGLREAGYDVTEVDVEGRVVRLPPDIEAVFIALHGAFGEDGAVQRLLQDRGVPYTGSGPEASRKAFDKLLTKEALVRLGVPTPQYARIAGPGAARTLPLPVIVKPVRQGSSLGVSRVQRDEEWAPALAEGYRYGDELLVEEFIEGRELTVGIVESQVLPVIEIVAPDGNYDYTAKYTRGHTQYRVPAPLDDATTRACQDAAWRTFEALGCRGLGRVDLRLGRDGRPRVLELNSIPGFTETSLLPKAAACAGIPFPQLCDRILRDAARPRAGG